MRFRRLSLISSTSPADLASAGSSRRWMVQSPTPRRRGTRRTRGSRRGAITLGRAIPFGIGGVIGGGGNYLPAKGVGKAAIAFFQDDQPG